MKFKILSLLFFFSLFISCTAVKELSLEESFHLKKNQFSENLKTFRESYNLPRSARLESIDIDYSNKNIAISFSREFAFIPLREDNVSSIYASIKDHFGKDFSDYKYQIYSINNNVGYKIEEFIPNYYRDKFSQDNSRLPASDYKNRIPIVKNLEKNYPVENGLDKMNILLWHSHGWYYNNKEKRWMWQRARLFQTIEDLLPASFTIPYLIPMLEKAGANVFVPRERDLQINEVIVDNDFDPSGSYIESVIDNNYWRTSDSPGFGMIQKTLKSNENPFKMGTNKFTYSSLEETATAQWLPYIPETGKYAVYVSYSASPDNTEDALYEVYHSGGITKFNVNQTIGGNTWIYLGTFKFQKGKFNDQGVVLSNRSSVSSKIVSADAVRFGGGMGIVEREGQTSRRPKYMEGARYWLQFAGMPDTLVFNLNNDSDDYKDDYQSRAEYGNYLYGDPYGPNTMRNEKGLGIPIDVSLSWHTDAGITRNDTVIGTLMIYSIPGMDSLHIFPDGVSRLANRDLSDIVQTQIVEDFRVKYDSVWTRRHLMNSLYSEAARPNFPSMLLELLSHQNFFDMKFAHDPRFKFDASRAIYKGILRFLSAQYGYKYIVQPLPVVNFSAELKREGTVHLRWKAKADELEPTAYPDKYVVYTRAGDGGFDNGTLVNSEEFVTDNIEKGLIYSFKVSAINTGGESLPSEILSVCWLGDDAKNALVINSFERVAPPASIESDSFSGFTDFIDEGVPDKFNIDYTGTQFNFDPYSEWETDDKPGHGASHANYETNIIAGNTFDFPFIHGKALVENGLSFTSASVASIIFGQIDMKDYDFVDIIFGEQKKTPMPKYEEQFEFETFPAALQDKIKKYLNVGGKLFLSGAYIASDTYSANDDSASIKFVNEVLKYYLRTGNAVKTGKLFSVNDNFISNENHLEFNTSFNDEIYKVEAPDAIAGINGGEILLRYSENNFSAAVGYNVKYGVVSFGFPFETISGENNRGEVMRAVLNYLRVK